MSAGNSKDKSYQDIRSRCTQGLGSAELVGVDSHPKHAPVETHQQGLVAYVKVLMAALPALTVREICVYVGLSLMPLY